MTKILRCECSRCKLYLRPAAEPSEQQYESAIQLKSVHFEGRKYQTSLLEYAKKHNIMACLPTGSGKTFIALKLLEFFKDDILTGGKKGIFLANTIPLVNQQAAFIARNSSFRVRHLTGDMEVDYWTQEVWKEVTDAFDVMMMTSQIFLNLVKHGFIRFSQVALLIFDECHHAIKDHPMCHIMKEYTRAKDSEKNYPLPRILGLTATIIMGTCKPREVPDKVRELEGTMQSVALTYKDYEEVLKHSTSAQVTPIRVENCSSGGVDFYDECLVKEMERLSKELGDFRKGREKAKMKALKLNPQCLDPKLRTFDNVYNLQAKKVSPGDLKVALEDVIHSYKDLGLYCTLITINLRLAFIKFSLMDVNDGEVKGWYERVKTYLENLKERFEWIINKKPYKKDQIVDFNSPKLNSLIKILETYRESEEHTAICEFGTDDNERLCGLIFTGRRTIAQVLAWYLKDLADFSKEAHGFIRPDFVVGTSQKAFESVESRVYARKQTATINKFRDKKLNLLTATSVLEEGIDVPSCNLVVRFDIVTTYTSYIQSMGRARKKNAKFFALIPSEKFSEGVERLRLFKEINENIISYLRANVEKIDAGDHSIQDILEKDLLPPICPGGTADSPKITMDSAADVVDRYCMLLPCDGISTLQSLSWWEECDFGNQFKAVIKMPLNSLVPEKIVGEVMRSKELAKQAAYLAAARRLLEVGVLDENLLPAHQTYPLQVRKYFEALLPTLSEATEGDEEVENVDKENGKPEAGRDEVGKKEDFGLKRIHREWYSKRHPKVLSSVFLEPGRQCYAYRMTFFLKEKSETNLWNNLFSLENSNVGFALICAQKLPSIGTFPLYGSFGTLQCSLKLIPNLRGLPFQTPLELEGLESFQSFLFSRILGIDSDFLKRTNRFPFLITAIKKVGARWELNTKEAEEGFREMEAIQNTRPPASRRSKDDVPPPQLDMTKFPPGTIVFPWYKRPNKPAYLVECISSKTPLSSYSSQDENSFYPNYKAFAETQLGFKVFHPHQPLLQCKLAGVAIGRCEKDPIQLNYLLQKFSKEDEGPVLMAPEALYSIGLPGSLLVQLKLLPSFIHRLSRLVLALELLEECSEAVGWPDIAQVGGKFQENDFQELRKAQEHQKGIEEERRKKRLELRNATLNMKNKRIRPPPPKVNMEERELHYEFIHPNLITTLDIKLFHEAVSSHHSAKKLILDKETVEIIPSELSPKSKFELLDNNELTLEPIEGDKEVSTDVVGPSLLSIMEALSLESSSEGASAGKLSRMGNSFLTFAVSLYAFSHWPEWGEPLLCQLRNRLLSLQMMNYFGKRVGLGEWLSGSDFNPGVSWIPPGKHVAGNLGEIAARHQIHLNCFEPLVKNKSLPVQVRSVEELERFAIEESKKAQVAAEEIKKMELPGVVAVNANNAPSGPPVKPKHRPGFSLRHATFSHCQLNDADISNGLSGLVGAYLKEGGPSAAYKALEWLQFKAPDSDGNARNLSDLGQGVHKLPSYLPYYNYEVQVLLTQLESVEQTIQYTFKNKRLLLQAFTHPTYPAHNLTECYQRLEFLGDAILDFLLTRYIYSLSAPSGAVENQKDFTPQELEDICSALINPVTYASLTVRYGLHKHLLSMSKALTDMIDNFVVHQESVEHHVVGHFTLISDEECWGAKHIEVPKVLSDIFEALAGAIYIDSGNSLDSVWRVFFRLTQYEIDWFTEKREKGPMHQLKVLADKEKFELKFQRTTGKKTQARGREIVRVNVGPYGHYFGVGTSRRRAKNAAAKIALKLIKEEDLFIRNRDATKIMLLC